MTFPSCINGIMALRTQNSDYTLNYPQFKLILHV